MTNKQVALGITDDMARSINAPLFEYGSVNGVKITANRALLFDSSLEITADVIQDFINIHRDKIRPKLLESQLMYLGYYHSILTRDQTSTRALDLPDNRVTVNFASYIVNSYNGYFTGIAPKIRVTDPDTDTVLQTFLKRSDMADNFAELSKIMAIYGHGYLYFYQGEDAKTYATYADPLNIFEIKSDDIAQTPLAHVVYSSKRGADKIDYITADVYVGADKFSYSEKDGTPTLVSVPDSEYTPYPFSPIIEFVENDERRSVFEPVKNLINTFNQALSDKVNDIEYFADAYLSVTGAKVDGKTVDNLNKNRIINAYGEASANVRVGFLERPDGDATQEHLLDRLQELIFFTAMTANVTDEEYGNASGTALEFKLLDMSNLAIAKERKFISGLKRAFRLWFNIADQVKSSHVDDWEDITYNFTRNRPRNIKEEVENAVSLEGVVSKETQLAQLSFIDDPKAEIEKMAQEEQDLMDQRVGTLGNFESHSPDTPDTHDIPDTSRLDTDTPDEEA